MCDFLQKDQQQSTSVVVDQTVQSAADIFRHHRHRTRSPSMTGNNNSGTHIDGESKKMRLEKQNEQQQQQQQQQQQVNNGNSSPSAISSSFNHHKTSAGEDKQLTSNVNCASSTSSTSSSANSFYETGTTVNNISSNEKTKEKLVNIIMGPNQVHDDDEVGDGDVDDDDDEGANENVKPKRIDNNEDSSLVQKAKTKTMFDTVMLAGQNPEDLQDDDNEDDEAKNSIITHKKNRDASFENPFMQSILNNIKGKGGQSSSASSGLLNLPNFLRGHSEGSVKGQQDLNPSALAAFMAMSPFFQQQQQQQQLQQTEKSSQQDLSPMLAAAAGLAFNKMNQKTTSPNQASKSSFFGSFIKNNNNNDRNNFMMSNNDDDSPPLSPMMLDSNLEHLPATTSTNGQQWTFEEQFKQLYELSSDPKRRQFLDDLFLFMQKRGTPVNRIPIMAKQVLDLHALYQLVVSRGGLVEVINKKLWREITKGLNLPSSITSAAFTLRTQYMKYLYPYECEKLRLSNPSELQSAIDGNRREARRASYNFDYPPLILSSSPQQQQSQQQHSPNNLNSGSTNNPHNHNMMQQVQTTKGHVESSASGFSNPFLNPANSEAMANFLSVSNLFPNGSPFNKSSTPMKNKTNLMNDERQSNKTSPLRQMDHMDPRSKSPEDESECHLFKRQKNSNDDTGHGSSNSSEDLGKSSSHNAYQQLLAAAMSGNPNLISSFLASSNAKQMKKSDDYNRQMEMDPDDGTTPTNHGNNNVGPLITLKTPCGLKNISDSPMRMCIQPGSQIGLPENAMMVMLELNRVSFQGVLFSNPSQHDKRPSS